jgi:hypothetical protein
MLNKNFTLLFFVITICSATFGQNIDPARNYNQGTIILNTSEEIDAQSIIIAGDSVAFYDKSNEQFSSFKLSDVYQIDATSKKNKGNIYGIVLGVLGGLAAIPLSIQTKTSSSYYYEVKTVEINYLPITLGTLLGFGIGYLIGSSLSDARKVYPDNSFNDQSNLQIQPGYDMMLKQPVISFRLNF